MSKPLKIFSLIGLTVSILGCCIRINGIRFITLNLADKIFNYQLDRTILDNTLYAASYSMFIVLTIFFVMLLTYRFWKKFISFISADNQSFIKYTTQIPILLIAFVFFLYVVKILFFVCKIVYFDWLVLIFAIVLQIIFAFLVFKKDTKKSIAISLISGYVIIAFSLIINALIYDYSWDGQSYHQAAIILLRNGWNPIYDSISDTTIMNSVTHFPKFTWVYSTVLASIFGTIEVGKSYNMLFLIVLFFYSLKIVSKYQKNSVITLIISILLVVSPVVLSQIYTYYVDGFLGTLILILVLSLLDFEQEQKKIALFVAFAVSVFVINVKFTGFVCGILLLGYLLKFLFLKKYKNALNITITGICVLIFALALGFNPYITNTISYGHPLYPLYGENATYQEHNNPARPQSIREKSYAQRFSSHFLQDRESKIGNIPFNPLKITKIIECNKTDRNIGGFGIFFFEIFLLIFVIVFLTIRKSGLKVYKNIAFASFLLLLITLIVPENWWARFVPYFWYAPILLLITANFKNIKMLAICLFMLIAVNNYVFYYYCQKYGIENTTGSKKLADDIKNSNNQNIVFVVYYEYFNLSIIEKMRFFGINKNFEFTTEKIQEMRSAYRIYDDIWGWYEK